MNGKVIYLLRHGETAWTLSGQHTSITDLSLTENGRLEAQKLGTSLKSIHFDHVFCSPLLRAKETCKIVGYENSALYDDDLIEWRYGDYEGKTSSEIRRQCPNWTVFSKDPPHGETSMQITTRVDRLLAKIQKLDGTIALFSSGHISRAIGARWIGCPVSFGQYLVLSTASKSILGFEHGSPAIRLWNDTSHLTS